MTTLTMSPSRSGLNPEDDNLSSWGSVENAPTSSSTAAAAASRPRQRRLSAPSRPASTGRGATLGSHSTRDVTASSSSNVAPFVRRRTGVTNTAGGGGDSSSDSRGAVRSRSTLRGATTTTGATSGVTDERPPWNQYTSGKTGKAKQPAVSTCGAMRVASPGPPVCMANGRRKKRLSADNSSGINGGTGAMRARCHDETETGEKEEESVESEIDAAAPSQHEIRRMIERIRRETDQEVMRSAGAAGSSSKHRAAFETDSSTASRGRTPTATCTSSRSMSLSATHRRTTSESSNVKPGGAEAGVVGMGEIEEEERRLREKASKLEVEMSAVQRRRVEVHLVKVEQQLQDEAASRLMLRGKRVRTELERACKALQEERDDRIGRVSAIKDDLRDKMEQLSGMYEEVSKRLEHLEVAYNDAEDQLRERASLDQRKAVEREERGVRRRIRAIMLDRGGSNNSNTEEGVEERSSERSSVREEDGVQRTEEGPPQKLPPQSQKRHPNSQKHQHQRVGGSSKEGTVVRGAGVKKSGDRARRRSAGSADDDAEARMEGVRVGREAGVNRGGGVSRRRRASVEPNR